MKQHPGALPESSDWPVIESWRTSTGAQCWTFCRDTTRVSVFVLPNDEGVRALFSDEDLALRAYAHAARCYAAVCDAALACTVEGRVLDVRLVEMAAGAIEMRGAEALQAIMPYFGKTLLGQPIAAP